MTLPKGFMGERYEMTWLKDLWFTVSTFLVCGLIAIAGFVGVVILLLLNPIVLIVAIICLTIFYSIN